MYAPPGSTPIIVHMECDTEKAHHDVIKFTTMPHKNCAECVATLFITNTQHQLIEYCMELNTIAETNHIQQTDLDAKM